jgi:pimeloyl-ACP methyl ester carboxylesterase
MKKLYAVVTLAAVLTGTTLLLKRTGRVAAAAAPSGIKNVVLVHGAFADGSGWEAVADILMKDGYTVAVVQEPETSFAEDVKFTKALIDQQSGPVVLVGHSYGGAVITEAGNDSKVAALVYIAAFAPDAGESSATLAKAMPPAGTGIKATPDGYLYIDPASFHADFAANLPEAEDRVHVPGYHSGLEVETQLVHGGHRRPVHQSGPGAHDGQARPRQDHRSKFLPCGVHGFSKGNSQANRRRCHLRARPSIACQS